MRRFATITHGLAAAAVVMFLGSGLTLATATAADTATPQQERMKTCNADATGKTGDARKAFMSDCLKGNTTASGNKLTTQQERMKSCNSKASGKTGDDRKAFMSTCLKG